tara:strand:+ start:1010 stop:1768 length:759 start_codon:yes stop_codon:yes gene_type:complete
LANLNTFGPKLKVTRAKHHIRDLESLIETFISDNPHRVEFNENSEGGLEIGTIFDRPLPNDVATIIGDAVHNLRSALDHLAGESLRAVNEVPDKSTGFPVYLAEADFNGGITSKLARAPQPFIDFIKGLKPYKTTKDGSPGNLLLWCLAQLDNLDKHLVLLPSIGAITIPDLNVFNADGSLLMSAKGTQLIGSVRAFSISGADVKYELDGDPTFGIRFNKTDIVDGAEVIPLLKDWEAEVSRIISDAGKLTL